MKTRSDFVSNSSSSSFILKDAGFFKHFEITKQDINAAIIELFGGEDYCEKLLEDAIEGCERRIAEIKAKNIENQNNEKQDNWELEYRTERLKELKTKGLRLWCIYDMTDAKDRKACFKEWDKHFSDWYAPNEGEYSAWDQFIEMLHWKCNFENIEYVANGEVKTLEVSVFDKKKNKYVHSKFPEGAAFIKHVRRSLKVKTMKEVLHDKACTLMVHFDDNEIYNIKGMSDDEKCDARDYRPEEENKKCKKSKWDSSSYTSDRFFEILIKYFIDKGRINLSDEALLEWWKVDDNDDWYKKNHPGKKYYLENDIATWKDVVDDILNCNSIMHEG